MSGRPDRWQVATTVGVLLLSTASSLLGLFRDGHYGDRAELIPRIMAQDAVILLVAVPVLGFGVWSATRGSHRGVIVWLGSLAFMTYIWGTYAVTIAFNAFFLGYVALFGLSLFTLVGGVVKLDATSMELSGESRFSRNLYAGFLAFAAVGLAALWLSEIILAMLTGTVPAAIDEFGAHAAVTYVIDLGVVVPLLAVTAVWLWRNRQWGDVIAGILLVFTAVLAPVITVITVVDIQEGVSMSAPVIIGSVVPPVVGAVFAGTYLYSLSSDSHS